MACIGVFGSAFDPPTRGHLDVLEQVAPQFDLILLVPNAHHAFNKQPLSFELRIQMLQAWQQDIQLPCELRVCDIEAALLQKKPNQPVYTFDLLEALEQQFNSAQLSFIRGSDNADPAVWQCFYKASEIEQRWQVVTATERVLARSSKVRTALAQLSQQTEQNHTDELLQTMLTPSVLTFIMNHQLYQPQ